MRKLNEFFFDVEEGEQSDYVSAAIFYGACVACVVGILTVAFPWLAL